MQINVYNTEEFYTKQCKQEPYMHVSEHDKKRVEAGMTDASHWLSAVEGKEEAEVRKPQ